MTHIDHPSWPRLFVLLLIGVNFAFTEFSEVHAGIKICITPRRCGRVYMILEFDIRLENTMKEEVGRWRCLLRLTPH
jgi:hypothetical protein